MSSSSTDMGNLSTKELREFGLTTGAIFAGLFGLLLPWLFDATYSLWPWVLGGTLAAAGLFVPRLLRPVHKGWLTLGHALGWINTRIILGILFYLVLLPIGAVARLFGHDFMDRRFENRAATYRIQSKEPPQNHFERPF